MSGCSLKRIGSGEGVFRLRLCNNLFIRFGYKSLMYCTLCVLLGQNGIRNAVSDVHVIILFCAVFFTA